MKTPITEAALTRSINLLLKRNKDANSKCENQMREVSLISQTTDTEERKKYNALMDDVGKLSAAIQRRECRLRKLKAKLAEIMTMKLV